MVDTLIFIAAILTVFLVLVILYVITGQSKLKAFITTITCKELDLWKSWTPIGKLKVAIQDY